MGGRADDERWLWNPAHEQLEDALEPVLADGPPLRPLDGEERAGLEAAVAELIAVAARERRP
jgi:hypothetical protein